MAGLNRSVVTDDHERRGDQGEEHQREPQVARRETVAAISHTGELKNTRNVRSSTGSARVVNDPAAAR